MAGLNFPPLHKEDALDHMRVIGKGTPAMTSIRNKIASYIKYRRALRELNTLEDRQLRDIGIARADFKTIARGEIC